MGAVLRLKPQAQAVPSPCQSPFALNADGREGVGDDEISLPDSNKNEY